jgi:multimeric flavodoxin WrbA
MKVVTIYGNMRHGSTWNAAQLVLNALAASVPLENREFVLPRDMDHFCNGCFTCLFKGEAFCPHAESIVPIAKAMMEADLIILASPTYALNVSGQMKAFLDHLCYLWLSHRPDRRMFDKAGLSVVTTAGAGKGHTAKTLNNSLRFWGLKRIFAFRTAVGASKWSEVKPEKQRKMARQADHLARKIIRTVGNMQRLPDPLIRTVMFSAMKGMMKKNTWNPIDKAHWVAQGWVREESNT